MIKNINDFFKKHYIHLALVIAILGIILIISGEIYKRRDDSDDKENQTNKETKCIESNCFPYKCKDTSRCATECIDNSNCVSSHSCINSRCVENSSPDNNQNVSNPEDEIWDLNL